MKIISIFKNHLKFTFKQGITPLLIFLYPIILIMIVGIALNISTTNKINIGIYGSDEIFDFLKNESSVNVINAENIDDLPKMIRNKKAIMGISTKEENGKKIVTIYLDPTKRAVTSNLLLILDKAVNEEKTKAGESLEEIQKKIRPKISEMKDKQKDIDGLLDEIEAIRMNISKTKQDLTTAKTKLSGYKTDLVYYNLSLSKIGDYNKKLDAYNNNLSSLYDEVYASEYERDNAVTKISNNIYKIDSYLYKIDNALFYIDSAQSSSNSSYTLYYIGEVKKELLEVRGNLTESKNDLTDIKTKLLAIDFFSIRNHITTVQSDLHATNNDLSSFKQTANSKIGSLLGEIDSVHKKIELAISALDDFDQKIISFETEANKTKNLIGSVIIPLEDFTGKKPKDLLPPNINTKSVFGTEKSIDMFFPSIIAVDMILVGLLLPMIIKVRLKEQGAELRIIRSRTSSISVVLGETMANYAVSLLQLALVGLFGIAFFGITVTNVSSFLLILITVHVVFTSMGVFFSQVVNRSSTAFLLSLLISIPMIFISGTIIPIEFLDPIMQTLGKLMPLYVIIEFTEKLFFRNVEVNEVVVNYLYIVTLTLLSLLLAILCYKLKK